MTFTLSLDLLYPGLATLVHQSLILFSVFLAALMFPDERTTLKSALFPVGMAAAIVGVASFFFFRERLTWLQLVGGVSLLAGCYLVIRARFRHIE